MRDKNSLTKRQKQRLNGIAHKLEIEQLPISESDYAYMASCFSAEIEDIVRELAARMQEDAMANLEDPMNAMYEAYHVEGLQNATSEAASDGAEGSDKQSSGGRDSEDSFDSTKAREHISRNLRRMGLLENENEYFDKMDQDNQALMLLSEDDQRIQFLQRAKHLMLPEYQYAEYVETNVKRIRALKLEGLILDIPDTGSMKGNSGSEKAQEDDETDDLGFDTNLSWGEEENDQEQPESDKQAEELGDKLFGSLINNDPASVKNERSEWFDSLLRSAYDPSRAEEYSKKFSSILRTSNSRNKLVIILETALKSCFNTRIMFSNGVLHSTSENFKLAGGALDADGSFSADVNTEGVKNILTWSNIPASVKSCMNDGFLHEIIRTLIMLYRTEARKACFRNYCEKNRGLIRKLANVHIMQKEGMTHREINVIKRMQVIERRARMPCAQWLAFDVKQLGSVLGDAFKWLYPYFLEAQHVIENGRMKREIDLERELMDLKVRKGQGKLKKGEFTHYKNLKSGRKLKEFKDKFVLIFNMKKLVKVQEMKKRADSGLNDVQSMEGRLRELFSVIMRVPDIRIGENESAGTYSKRLDLHKTTARKEAVKRLYGSDKAIVQGTRITKSSGLTECMLELEQLKKSEDPMVAAMAELVVSEILSEGSGLRSVKMMNDVRAAMCNVATRVNDYVKERYGRNDTKAMRFVLRFKTLNTSASEIEADMNQLKGLIGQIIISETLHYQYNDESDLESISSVLAGNYDSTVQSDLWDKCPDYMSFDGKTLKIREIGFWTKPNAKRDLLEAEYEGMSERMPDKVKLDLAFECWGWPDMRERGVNHPLYRALLKISEMRKLLSNRVDFAREMVHLEMDSAAKVRKIRNKEKLNCSKKDIESFVADKGVVGQDALQMAMDIDGMVHSIEELEPEDRDNFLINIKRHIEQEECSLDEQKWLMHDSNAHDHVKTCEAIMHDKFHDRNGDVKIGIKDLPTDGSDQFLFQYPVPLSEAESNRRKYAKGLQESMGIGLDWLPEIKKMHDLEADLRAMPGKRNIRTLRLVDRLTDYVCVFYGLHYSTGVNRGVKMMYMKQNKTGKDSRERVIKKCRSDIMKRINAITNTTEHYTKMLVDHETGKHKLDDETYKQCEEECDLSASRLIVSICQNVFGSDFRVPNGMSKTRMKNRIYAQNQQMWGLLKEIKPYSYMNIDDYLEAMKEKNSKGHGKTAHERMFSDAAIQKLNDEEMKLADVIRDPEHLLLNEDEYDAFSEKLRYNGEPEVMNTIIKNLSCELGKHRIGALASELSNVARACLKCSEEHRSEAQLTFAMAGKVEVVMARPKYMTCENAYRCKMRSDMDHYSTVMSDSERYQGWSHAFLMSARDMYNLEPARYMLMASYLTESELRHKTMDLVNGRLDPTCLNLCIRKFVAYVRNKKKWDQSSLSNTRFILQTSTSDISNVPKAYKKAFPSSYDLWGYRFCKETLKCVARSRQAKAAGELDLLEDDDGYGRNFTLYDPLLRHEIVGAEQMVQAWFHTSLFTKHIANERTAAAECADELAGGYAARKIQHADGDYSYMGRKPKYLLVMDGPHAKSCSYWGAFVVACNAFGLDHHDWSKMNLSPEKASDSVLSLSNTSRIIDEKVSDFDKEKVLNDLKDKEMRAELMHIRQYLRVKDFLSDEPISREMKDNLVRNVLKSVEGITEDDIKQFLSKGIEFESESIKDIENMSVKEFVSPLSHSASQSLKRKLKGKSTMDDDQYGREMQGFIDLCVRLEAEITLLDDKKKKDWVEKGEGTKVNDLFNDVCSYRAEFLLEFIRRMTTNWLPLCPQADSGKVNVARVIAAMKEKAKANWLTPECFRAQGLSALGAVRAPLSATERMAMVHLTRVMNLAPVLDAKGGFQRILREIFVAMDLSSNESRSELAASGIWFCYSRVNMSVKNQTKVAGVQASNWMPRSKKELVSVKLTEEVISDPRRTDIISVVNKHCMSRDFLWMETMLKQQFATNRAIFGQDYASKMFSGLMDMIADSCNKTINHETTHRKDAKDFVTKKGGQLLEDNMTGRHARRILNFCLSTDHSKWGPYYLVMSMVIILCQITLKQGLPETLLNVWLMYAVKQYCKAIVPPYKAYEKYVKDKLLYGRDPPEWFSKNLEELFDEMLSLAQRYFVSPSGMQPGIVHRLSSLAGIFIYLTLVAIMGLDFQQSTRQCTKLLKMTQVELAQYASFTKDSDSVRFVDALNLQGRDVMMHRMIVNNPGFNCAGKLTYFVIEKDGTITFEGKTDKCHNRKLPNPSDELIARKVHHCAFDLLGKPVEGRLNADHYQGSDDAADLVNGFYFSDRGMSKAGLSIKHLALHYSTMYHTSRLSGQIVSPKSVGMSKWAEFYSTLYDKHKQVAPTSKWTYVVLRLLAVVSSIELTQSLTSYCQQLLESGGSLLMCHLICLSWHDRRLSWKRVKFRLYDPLLPCCLGGLPLICPSSMMNKTASSILMHDINCSPKHASINKHLLFRFLGTADMDKDAIETWGLRKKADLRTIFTEKESVKKLRERIKKLKGELELSDRDRTECSLVRDFVQGSKCESKIAEVAYAYDMISSEGMLRGTCNNFIVHTLFAKGRNMRIYKLNKLDYFTLPPTPAVPRDLPEWYERKAACELWQEQVEERKTLEGKTYGVANEDTFAQLVMYSMGFGRSRRVGIAHETTELVQLSQTDMYASIPQPKPNELIQDKVTIKVRNFRRPMLENAKLSLGWAIMPDKLLKHAPSTVRKMPPGDALLIQTYYGTEMESLRRLYRVLNLSETVADYDTICEDCSNAAPGTLFADPELENLRKCQLENNMMLRSVQEISDLISARQEELIRICDGERESSIRPLISAGDLQFTPESKTSVMFALRNMYIRDLWLDVDMTEIKGRSAIIRSRLGYESDYDYLLTLASIAYSSNSRSSAQIMRRVHEECQVNMDNMFTKSNAIKVLLLLYALGYKKDVVFRRLEDALLPKHQSIRVTERSTNNMTLISSQWKETFLTYCSLGGGILLSNSDSAEGLADMLMAMANQSSNYFRALELMASFANVRSDGNSRILVGLISKGIIDAQDCDEGMGNVTMCKHNIVSTHGFVVQDSDMVSKLHVDIGSDNIKAVLVSVSLRAAESEIGNLARAGGTRRSVMGVVHFNSRVKDTLMTRACQTLSGIQVVLKGKQMARGTVRDVDDEWETVQRAAMKDVRMLCQSMTPMDAVIEVASRARIDMVSILSLVTREMPEMSTYLYVNPERIMEEGFEVEKLVNDDGSVNMDQVHAWNEEHRTEYQSKTHSEELHLMEGSLNVHALGLIKPKTSWLSKIDDKTVRYKGSRQMLLHMMAILELEPLTNSEIKRRGILINKDAFMLKKKMTEKQKKDKKNRMHDTVIVPDIYEEYFDVQALFTSAILRCRDRVVDEIITDAIACLPDKRIMFIDGQMDIDATVRLNDLGVATTMNEFIDDEDDFDIEEFNRMLEEKRELDNELEAMGLWEDVDTNYDLIDGEDIETSLVVTGEGDNDDDFPDSDDDSIISGEMGYRERKRREQTERDKQDNFIFKRFFDNTKKAQEELEFDPDDPDDDANF